MKYEAAYAELGQRFELVGELGRGAMGVVFRARERSSGRDVALKVVLKADPTRIERFRREGELTARLNHPGIVRIHTFGQAAGMPYLAYELVESARGLHEVLPEVDPRRRVELIRDVAAALGHAHAHGVVHRDMKPENVLVDANGQVRVADFGIATAQDVDRLTKTGAFVGTPSYLAPEQIAAERAAIGPASDVWALGVVLYEALTGVLPFAGESIIHLAAAINQANPLRPRQLERTIPRALEAVCLRALRRPPAERYPDAAAFAADLERFLRGERVEAVPPLSRRFRAFARRRWWLVPVAGAAGAVVFAAFASSRAPAEPGASPAPDPKLARTGLALPQPKRDLGPLPPVPQRSHPLIASIVDRIEAGDAEAAAVLGRFYQRGGSGVVSDPAASEAWYRRAVAMGSGRAVLRLGDVLLERGKKREAAEWWERAARTKGCEVDGARRLAKAAVDDKKDLTRAVRWVRRLFEHKDNEWGYRLSRSLVANFRRAALDQQAAAIGSDWPGAKMCSAIGQAYLIRHRWGRGRLERQAAERWFGRGGRAGSAVALVRLVRLTQEDRGPVFTMALGLLKDRAAEGKANAQWALGRLHLDGDGLPQNDAKAAHYFGLAAHREARATVHLAKLHRDGRGVKRDLALAARLLRRVAGEGHPDAMLELVRLLVAGRVEPVQADEPQRLLKAAFDAGNGLAKKLLRTATKTRVHPVARAVRQAAEGGDVEAMVNAGQMARMGRGLPRDVLYAGRLFLRAGRKGHASAMWELARLLLEEFSDVSGYLHCGRRAAEAGSTTAMRMVGVLLHQGERNLGLAPNPARGIAWIRKSHAKGDALSTLSLADALTDPRSGTLRDLIEAKRLYRQAAERGRARGWVGLGRLLLPGQPRKARIYFERAHKAGLGNAVRWLAELHLRGWGVPKSHTKAAALLEQAAATDVECRWLLGLMAHTGQLGPKRINEGYRRIQSAARNGSFEAQKYLSRLDRGE